MNVVQILKEARALISDEKNWTQGAYARDTIGREVRVLGPEAMCFCALGALEKIMLGGAMWSASYMLMKKEAGDDCLAVSDFNDTHNHAEVLALFDRAIARAESEAA